MKLLLPFIAIVCLSSCFRSQTNANITAAKPTDTVANPVYRYKNQFFDLTNLKLIDTNALKTFTEIKRESLYVSAFESNQNDKRAVYKNIQFALNEKRSIEMTDLSGHHLKTIVDPDHSIPVDNIVGNAVLFATSTGVFTVIRLSESYGYHVKKYDENGTLLNTWKLEHTQYNKHDNEIESLPYLFYFAHTDREAVFGTIYSGGPQQTVVLNLNDGAITKLDHSTGGIIINPKDNSLAGTVYFNYDKKTMEVTMGNTSWTNKNETSDDAAKTVLNDSVLYVAQYPVISSGCYVNAYNAYTGKLIWKGDVAQLNVPHSEYYNIVHLTLFNNKLILEGNEAGGNYLQILDCKTGKRLFECLQ